jgi:hypothetical protein
MLQIRFKDWSVHQNREVKTATKWVRIPNNFLNTPQAWSLEPEELYAYIYLICEASKYNKNGLVLINHEHAHKQSRVQDHVLNRTIKKLKQLQIIEIRTTRGKHAQIPESSLREEKRREEKRNIIGVLETPNDSSFETKNWEPIQELELIYQLYPKRENTNKKRGMQNLLAKVKTPVQVAEFERAVRNYADYCKQKKIEPVFVKQFSTFTNNYEEWITVEKVVTKTNLQKWEEKGDDDET